MKNNVETLQVSRTCDDKTCMNPVSCITNFDVDKCVSIGSVLGVLLSNESSGIDTICLNDSYTSDESDAVFVKNIYSTPGRKVTISCLKPCNLTFDLVINFRYFSPNVIIVLQNATILSSSISVQNIGIHFNDLVFVNSIVSDVAPRAGEFGEINLWFTFVTFSFSFELNHPQSINIEETFKFSCQFLKTTMKNTNIKFDSSAIWISASQSSFTGRGTTALLGQKLLVNFDTVMLSCHDNPCLKINAGKIKAKFSNLTLESSEGGIHLHSESTYFISSWIEVDVLDSTFQNNTVHGSGGALEVQFRWETMNPYSHLNISGCVFRQNTLTGSSNRDSFGGAISVKNLFSLRNEQKFNLIFVRIENCQFVDNQAENGGGALFFRGEFISVVVHQCEFINSDGIAVAGLGVFILGFTEICVTGASVRSAISSSSTSLIWLQMLSTTSSIRCLSFKIKCLPWHNLKLHSAEAVTSLNDTKFVAANVFCAGCSPSYYIPSEGSNSVSDLRKYRSLSREQKSCIPCPAGGECSGTDLKAKPNYWGFNSSGLVEFQQCPIGYCCGGTDENPCSSFNSCAGERDGILCSSCKEHYSQSLLSDTCIANDDCTATWFWTLAVLAPFVYMLWYTFKDDIMNIPIVVVEKLKRKHVHEAKFVKGEQRVHYIDKGYFGILIYFVQATAVLRSGLLIQSSDEVHNTFRKIETYIGLLLTIELSYMPADVCPIQNLTVSRKVLAKFVFILGIFGSWVFIFVLFSIFKFMTNWVCKKNSLTSGIRAKLLGGLVKIIKYSYGGLTKMVFFSLLCVKMMSKKVWFYDASVDCFSVWQMTMIVFGLCYVLPFPFMLFLGMNCLKRGKISGNILLLGTFCPLPFLAFFLVKFLSHSKITASTNKEKESVVEFKNEYDRQMYRRFMRGYRMDGEAQYWECLMFLKRLLLNLTTLIPNPVIRLGICLILCTIFVVHHDSVKPFVNPTSNKVEVVSLLLLCAEASSNLVKSIYINLGVSPGTPQAELLESLSFIETLFLPCLLALILLLELKEEILARKQRRD